MSPIIGGFSIYLIYKTFKAQGEQLEDQKKATKTESDAVYVSELRNLLEEVDNQLESIQYTVPNMMLMSVHNGLEAVSNWVSVHQTKDGFIGSLTPQDKRLISDVRRSVELFCFVVGRLFANKSLLKRELGKMFQKRLQLAVAQKFIIILDLVRTIQSELEVVNNKSQEENEKSSASDETLINNTWSPNVNFLIAEYNALNSALDALSNCGMLMMGEKNATLDEYLETGEVNKNELKKIDFNSVFVIKKY